MREIEGKTKSIKMYFQNVFWWAKIKQTIKSWYQEH